MKLLLITCILLLNTFAHAGLLKSHKIYLRKDLKATDKLERITYDLIESKYYFSASVFVNKRIKRDRKIGDRFEDAILTTAIKTGIDTFWELSSEELSTHSSPTLSFSHGLKLFKEQDFNKAYNELKKVPRDHKFSPEARLIQGSINQLFRKKTNAKSKYRDCITDVDESIKSAKFEKLKRYYTIIGETCRIHIARMEYATGNYKKAVTEFNKISKNSYKWPYILIEKAWAHYQLKDYNRTLGLLVTYKSPLLTSYFFPEAEVLGALTYHRLCLWNDSSIIIQKYYSDYRKRSSELKKLLVHNKKSDSYFLKLALAPISKGEKLHPYIRNLVTQVKKQIKFSMDYVPIKRAENELKHLKRFDNFVFTSYLQKKVSQMANIKRIGLNQFIKRSMFDFINQIHRYSKEMFKIKLEIMSNQRSLIYQNKKLISKRSRGDIDNVQQKEKQHFWKFRGEFWADELGDYSFGLKSNCRHVNKTRD
ncbi:MAG: hypothetical protein KAG61_10360 [Bacteriovoracaceae bacterium]|nr:hypothetical protein [Bacteriovoracaceae bacterium]